MNNKEFEKINKEVFDKVETNKKRNINEELHKKINERKEGEFYKKSKRVIDEDGAFKGEYRKNSINEELHRKINEREEGYYFKKQFEKIELDIETKYKSC